MLLNTAHRKTDVFVMEGNFKQGTGCDNVDMGQLFIEVAKTFNGFRTILNLVKEKERLSLDQRTF